MKVKKLEWIEKTGLIYQDVTVFFYSIYESDRKVLEPFHLYTKSEPLKTFKTLEDAKVYCQNHYNEFILSQIEVENDL